MDVIWRVHKNNEQLQAKLIPFLPLEYKYKVVEYNLLEDSQIPLERKFYAEFHVQGICSKEHFYSFLDAISDLTSTSWNKSHRDISDLGAPRRIFRGERKCHMNVRKQISKITGEMSKDQTPGKNTECPSTIRFHINRHDRHTDEDCKEYHCVVRIDFNHNHRITTHLNGCHRRHAINCNTSVWYIYSLKHRKETCITMAFHHTHHDKTREHLGTPSTEG